ncbi:hypothetical protein L195_g063542, partial [Trifolium pratense]
MPASSTGESSSLVLFAGGGRGAEEGVPAEVPITCTEGVPGLTSWDAL